MAELEVYDVKERLSEKFKRILRIIKRFLKVGF